MTDDEILAVYRTHKNWTTTARIVGRSRHRIKLAVRRAVLAEAEPTRRNGQ